jgi:uncharacterized protein (DUF58 family)
MAAAQPSPPLQDSEALAASLEGILLEARRLAAFAPGVHGRRRPGEGEAFWQYREHGAQDGLRAVDWRRSARGERLFVREREREAAQTLWLWVDGGPGMQWASAPQLPHKHHRALVLALACAMAVTKSGERAGVLGLEAVHRGPQAGARLAVQLAAAAAPPQSPAKRGVLVLASDFLEGEEVWSQRLRAISPGPHGGVLLQIADPAEEDFPFEGRVMLREPGSRREALLGRAESARERYRERLTQHRRAIAALAARYGLGVMLHRTDQPAAPALAGLLLRLSAER